MNSPSLAPSVEGQELQHLRKINHLGAELSIDFVAGFATSLLVAPFVAIIDKAIVTNASGQEPFNQGIKRMGHMLVTNPIKFARQRYFLPVFIIFGGTYSVANSVETMCHASHTPVTLPKFLVSSSVNIGLNAWKDSLYTQWYGTGKPKAIPTVTLGLFAVRDSLTVATAFLVPPLISPYLQAEPFNMPKRVADFTAQLTAPCAIQLASTQIHLYALDLYNHPNITFKERMALISKNYWKTAYGRIIRTLPGFGVGGVCNKHLRHDMIHFVHDKWGV